MSGNQRPVVIMPWWWEVEDARAAVQDALQARRDGVNLPLHFVVDPATGKPISKFTHTAASHEDGGGHG